jgi:3-oxoacyl-[acyl-carrier-protein] synthase II
MAASNRVVVTGLGVIAPGGIGKDAFWKLLASGKSAIRLISLFDARQYDSRIAGEVTEFDLTDFLTPKTRVKYLARHTQLALAAAKLAVDDARLASFRPGDGEDVPVCLGVSTSAMEVVHYGTEIYIERGPGRVPPNIVTSGMPQQVAHEVAQEFGLATSSHAISAACSSGLDAILEAAASIRSGRADVAVAGGTDAPLCPTFFAFLDRASLASRHNECPDRASRPFDRDCDSGVISEGAGIVVLENLEHALARRATVYLEITGGARHMDTDPEDPLSGLLPAMELALANAGRRPKDIDFICAHGPGHPVIDRAEVRKIKACFGERAYQIPVSSIKGAIGNPLAASGPLQLISCALTMANNRIPPIANLENPAPDNDLDFVVGRPRAVSVRRALINLHGLGGGNGCMVVERVEET